MITEYPIIIGNLCTRNGGKNTEKDYLKNEFGIIEYD
jgi:hypothetical protein